MCVRRVFAGARVRVNACCSRTEAAEDVREEADVEQHEDEAQDAAIESALERFSQSMGIEDASDEGEEPGLRGAKRS